MADDLDVVVCAFCGSDDPRHDCNTVRCAYCNGGRVFIVNATTGESRPCPDCNGKGVI